MASHPLPSWATNQAANQPPVPTMVDEFLILVGEDTNPGWEYKLESSYGYLVWSFSLVELLYRLFCTEKRAGEMQEIHDRLVSDPVRRGLIHLSGSTSTLRIRDWGWSVHQARLLSENILAFTPTTFPTFLSLLALEYGIQALAPPPSLRQLVTSQLAVGSISPTSVNKDFEIRLGPGLTTCELPQIDEHSFANSIYPNQHCPLTTTIIYIIANPLYLSLPFTGPDARACFMTKGEIVNHTWFGQHILRILLTDVAASARILAGAPRRVGASHIVAILSSRPVLRAILRRLEYSTKNDKCLKKSDPSSQLLILISLAYQLDPEALVQWIEAVFGYLADMLYLHPELV